MTKQTINVGATANDKQGDSLRAAFQKVNANFTELYTALGINEDTDLNLGAFEFAGSVMTTTDSTDITVAQNVRITSNLTIDGDLSLKDSFDSSQPMNTNDPEGWLKIILNGELVYIPYYK
jgi:hypothetical protein